MTTNTEFHVHAGNLCNGKRYLAGGDGDLHFLPCPRTYKSPLMKYIDPPDTPADRDYKEAVKRNITARKKECEQARDAVLESITRQKMEAEEKLERKLAKLVKFVNQLVKDHNELELRLAEVEQTYGVVHGYDHEKRIAELEKALKAAKGASAK
jgi:hypothetical protein